MHSKRERPSTEAHEKMWKFHLEMFMLKARDRKTVFTKPLTFGWPIRMVNGGECEWVCDNRCDLGFFRQCTITNFFFRFGFYANWQISPNRRAIVSTFHTPWAHSDNVGEKLSKTIKLCLSVTRRHIWKCHMQITKMWAVNIWLISFIIHNSDENNGPISNDTKTDSIFVFFINDSFKMNDGIKLNTYIL